MYSFKDLARILEGKMLCESNRQFSDISIDSRTIVHPKSTLFFAIEGKYHDGHDYILKLYQTGVRQFVVSKSIDCTSYPEAGFFKCSNTINALQALASHHRQQFNLPIIGITGSNGKTIVKEWLNQILSFDHTIVKSPKSYNSQVGVPLSLWQTNETHTLGIFEAGISTYDEMANLQAIIQPTVGIITNIGSAHAHGFNSIEDKLYEKLKLFSQSATIIYCADHKNIHQVLKTRSKIFSWGHEAESSLRILNVIKKGNQTNILLQDHSKSFHILFPFSDNASIENAMHCVAYMVWAGYDAKEINKRIKKLKGVPMRLELKQGINGCKIIDDSYNNDLAGIKIALEFMEQQNPGFSKTIIVSDILQTEKNKALVYAELAALVQHHSITKIISIGPDMKEHFIPSSVPSFSSFLSTNEFLERFNLSTLKDEIVLVKGARTFGFEKIVSKLQQKIHGTRLEINLNAISRNLNYYRSKINTNTKIMVMVKALGYGSGSHEIAHLLQHHHVDYLGVAYADEGIDLRKHNISLPIMVMNPSYDSFHSIIENDLEPELYGIHILNELIDTVRGHPVKVHLKIDTGMHRLGFTSGELPELIDILKKNQNIEVKSIFTHLAGADEEKHTSFSMHQVDLFNKALKMIISNLNISPLIHIVNSAGILRFPEYHYDMVRLGIGLYGIEANGQEQLQLEPISTLKTVVSKIVKVNKGESIGYSRKYTANSNMTIATIAIGYADGFTRAFSNGIGKVVINQKLAPVVGNVCMDMSMIDVTGIKVKEGDEVEVFGKQLSIIDVANSINTIPYEILTNVSNRVKRVYYLD